MKSVTIARDAVLEFGHKTNNLGERREELPPRDEAEIILLSRPITSKRLSSLANMFLIPQQRQVYTHATS